MKKLFVCLFALILFAGIQLDLQARQIIAESDSTTLIFVRHAEKTDSESKDPELSPEGLVRANLLAEILSSEYTIGAIYSTPYKRTMMTAGPLSDSLGLKIKEYGFDDPVTLIQSLISEYKGKAVLIVGHSNTTPMLVNITLGEQKYQQLDESDYSNIFIIRTQGKGKAKLMHRTY